MLKLYSAYQEVKPKCSLEKIYITNHHCAKSLRYIVLCKQCQSFCSNLFLSSILTQFPTPPPVNKSELNNHYFIYQFHQLGQQVSKLFLYMSRGQIFLALQAIYSLSGLLNYNLKAAIGNTQMSSYGYVPIKLFTKTAEDKRLISKIYEELLKFNNQKSKQPN